MKRLQLIYAGAILLTLLSTYFLYNIALNIYFNNKFYSLPNMVGMTLEQTKEIKKINKVKVTEAGEGYSNYPAGTIFKQNPVADKVVKKGRIVRVWISKGKNNYTVPNLVNKNLIEASTILQQNGIKIRKITYTDSNLPYNTVIATTPSSDEPAQASDGISLLLSNSTGPQDDNSTVPNIIGLSLAEAKEKLIDKGFAIGNITYNTSEDNKEAVVLESPESGKSLPPGSKVNLIVGE